MSEHWMTYREAAAQHGVTAEAIRQLALRRHWPRRRTNTMPPRVEVLVPEGEQITPKPVAVQRPSNDRSTRVRPDMNSIVSAFADAVAALTKRAEAAEAGRAGAEAQAAELRTQVEALQAGQDLMMDMHAGALAAAQDQLARVREAAEALRQAETERQARGWLARLRAAVRGR
jgi:hypothetical protein